MSFGWCAGGGEEALRLIKLEVRSLEFDVRSLKFEVGRLKSWKVEKLEG